MALAVNFPQIDMKSLNNPLHKENTFTNVRSIKSRKCLFGPTNSEETYQMVKENFDQERERFYIRFGIHMEDLERLAVDKADYQKLKCLPSTYQTSSTNNSGINAGGKITRKSFRMKRALKPYNANINKQQPLPTAHQQLQQQMKITDYCQVKKSPTTDTIKTQEKEKKLQQGL